MKGLTFSVSVPQWLALKALGPLSSKLFYSGPLATVKLAELPEPGPPRAGWVKINTIMCGFCASDLNLLMLHDSPTASPFTSFPCVMGHEVCGEIAEVGPGVEGLAPGDFVAVVPALPCAARGIDPPCPACAKGWFAACENTAEGDISPGMFTGICADTGGGFSPKFTAHQSQCFKLPEGFSPEAGALMEPFSVGLQAAYTNPPNPGEEVLVIGGGVIGNMVVHGLRSLDIDCKITVAERSGFAADFCRQAGADRVLLGGDLFAHAAEITGSKTYKPMIGPPIAQGGFSRIYDTVGSQATLNTAMRIMAAGGTLSQVGIGSDVKLDLTPLWLKRQSIVGVYATGYAQYRGQNRHMFDIGIDLVHSGKVDISPMVTHRYALDDYQALINDNLDKQGKKMMKAVVSFA